MVGRLVCFCNGLCSGAMLVSVVVKHIFFTNKNSCIEKTWHGNSHVMCCCFKHPIPFPRQLCQEKPDFHRIFTNWAVSEVKLPLKRHPIEKNISMVSFREDWEGKLCISGNLQRVATENVQQHSAKPIMFKKGSSFSGKVFSTKKVAWNHPTNVQTLIKYRHSYVYCEIFIYHNYRRKFK